MIYRGAIMIVENNIYPIPDLHQREVLEESTEVIAYWCLVFIVLQSHCSSNRMD